jgi:heat shock transcription factor
MASVDAAAGVAPFVAKTYRMVDDPSTDAVIAWGRDSNSFVVADPFAFSQTLLPAHLKHSNFSSFVRQLNTYVRARPIQLRVLLHSIDRPINPTTCRRTQGFRKVDPDRWEFAHVAFLRGHTHLLPQIVRRGGGGKRKDDVGSCAANAGAAADEDAVAMEVVRLRREQRAIEDQVAAMSRRVQETERRPKQMLAFLLKVAGDPQVMCRLVSSTAAGAGSDCGGAVRFAAGPAAADLGAGFYGAGVEDVGFGGEYLQPPPDVFPVNSGY